MKRYLIFLMILLILFGACATEDSGADSDQDFDDPKDEEDNYRTGGDGLVEIENMYSYEYVISKTYLRMTGEVRNIGDKPVSFVDVEFVYKDSEGNPKSTNPTGVILLLKPGQKAPFYYVTDDFSSKDVDARVVELRMGDAGVYDNEYALDDPFEVVESFLTPGAYTKVNGKIKNTALGPVTGHAGITYYNSEGKVIEIGTDTFYNVPAGEIVPLGSTVSTGDEVAASYSIDFTYQ
jgi:hypothetical protein